MNLVNKHGNITTARAILDSGFQLSLITNKLIKKLGLSTHHLNVAVHGIGGNLSCKQAADIKFTSRVDSGREFSASCPVVEYITGKLPQFPINLNKLDIPGDIILADPKFNYSQDVYYNLITPHLIS